MYGRLIQPKDVRHMYPIAVKFWSASMAPERLRDKETGNMLVPLSKEFRYEWMETA